MIVKFQFANFPFEKEVLKKAGDILDASSWEQWHCAILIESDKTFFDTVSDSIDKELMEIKLKKMQIGRNQVVWENDMTGINQYIQYIME